MATKQPPQLLVYFVGSVANNALTFILLPLYIRYLSRSDYGVVAVLTTVNTAAGILAGAGILSGLTRLYYEEGREDQKMMAGTVLAWVAGTSLLLGCVMFLGAPWLAEGLFRTSDFAGSVRLASAAMIVAGVQYGLYSILRLEMRATLFVAISLAGFLADVGLKIYFLAIAGWGVNGYFLASILSGSLTILLAVVVLRDAIRLKVRREMLEALLRLGSPFIISALLMWALDVSDNLLLNLFVGPDAVAVYSVAYKVASVFRVLLLAPLSLFWNPFFFSHGADYGEESMRILLSRCIPPLAWVGGMVAVAVSAGSEDLIRLLDSNRLYGDAPLLVPALLTAPFLYVLSFPAGSSILQSKQIKYAVYAIAAGAGANIVSNLILIPRLSYFGAALSTALGYSVYFVLECYFGQRLFRLRYDWAGLLKVVFCAAAAIVGSRLAVVSQPWVSLFLRELLGLGLYFALTAVLGLPGVRDAKRLWGQLHTTISPRVPVMP